MPLPKTNCEVAVFGNRERFIKIVVWVVVISMLLTIMASLASVF